MISRCKAGVHSHVSVAEAAEWLSRLSCGGKTDTREKMRNAPEEIKKEGFIVVRAMKQHVRQPVRIKLADGDWLGGYEP